MLKLPLKEALTFDDVLLVPAHSVVLPGQVSTRTRLTRRIDLNVPLVSAAMDTVTESRLAIAIAQEGGLGIIHKNMSIKSHAAEVDKVKRSESGMIVDPITMTVDALIGEALEVMSRYHISGVPVTDDDGRLVGILTNRDLRFHTRNDLPVSSLMTTENLVTVPVGTTLEQAKTKLHQHRIEKLPVVDDDGILKGLITVKDIQKQIKFPDACKDDLGRLRVGGRWGSPPIPWIGRKRWFRPGWTWSWWTRPMATARGFWTWWSGSGASTRISSSSAATWQLMKGPRRSSTGVWMR